MPSRAAHPSLKEEIDFMLIRRRHAAIWAIVRGPVRNHENDCELRIAVGRKLMNLVADGVTDPIRLRQLTVKSLFVPGR